MRAIDKIILLFLGVLVGIAIFIPSPKQSQATPKPTEPSQKLSEILPIISDKKTGTSTPIPNAPVDKKRVPLGNWNHAPYR